MRGWTSCSGVAGWNRKCVGTGAAGTRTGVFAGTAAGWNRSGLGAAAGRAMGCAAVGRSGTGGWNWVMAGASGA